MALTLDLRAPVIVLIGRFNPAIFEVPWVGKHLLGKGEDDPIDALEVVIQNEHGLTQFRFLEDVALHVQPTRTDVLIQDGSVATMSAAERRVLTMLETLPHTPISAIGFNFTFTDDAPAQAVADLFETPEGFEGTHEVQSRQLTTRLKLDGSVLNFSRALSEGNCRFSFNYHTDEKDAAKYNSLIVDRITAHLEHAWDLLKTSYGYAEYSIVSFTDSESFIEAQNVEITND